jgi:hypothetical protein
MAHSRLSPLHAVLEESSNKDGLASSKGESSDFPIPMVCNMVTSANPIVTTPTPEETLVLQTTPVVPQRAAIL